MCSHCFVVTKGRQCCTYCGISEQVLTLDRFSPHASPLGRQYDRFARFQMKIDKLLGMGGLPRYDDPVWKVLEKADMKTPQDVRSTLRQSGLTCKHYDCVRTFCDYFTPFYCDPVNTLDTKHHLERRFVDVKARWGMKDGFFSYDWLLRLFLEEMKSPLVCYLKKPTNRRREQKYRKMLHDLIPEDEYKTLSRSSEALHSQND